MPAAVPTEDLTDSITDLDSVGRDLRALRKSRGLTLTELAGRVNRSTGFLSQVERGLSSPSIDDLRDICAALDVPTGWLFMQREVDDADREFIVRAGSRRSLGTRESGIVEELLSPDLGGSFEMFRSVFAAGAQSSAPIYRETEEAGYLIAGQLQFWIGDTEYQLMPGDSFRFKNKPYRWKNNGPDDAIVIWVVSPPIY
jgi:transcriptional regulator with XRE-family HTH domain